MNKVMGIDPGLDGGVAVLSSLGVEAYLVMPTIEDSRINAHELLGWLRTYGRDVTLVALEQAQYRPGQAVKATFTAGKNFGSLITVLEFSKLPFMFVSAGTWGKVSHAGLPASLAPKEKSRLALRQLFPDLFEELKFGKRSKPHEGVMDAVLIAYYARQSAMKTQERSA